MPRHPIELPPEVARAFLEAAKAYFKETDHKKQHEILAAQRFILNEYLPGKEKLRLDEVVEMFLAMKNDGTIASQP